MVSTRKPPGRLALKHFGKLRQENWINLILESLEELKVPPGNRLESLAGDRKTEHSIRINERYRICFMWGKSGPYNVEVTDYH